MRIVPRLLVAAVVGLLVVVSAGAARADTTSLTFATYNICKVDCAAPAPGSDVRRERLARVLGALGADVIGLQEATEQPVRPGGPSQWLDIRRLAEPLGLAAPHHPARNDTCGTRACTHTARLLYRTATVAPVRAADGSLAAGYLAARDVVDGLGPDSASREIAWAYLRARSGGEPFLAIALHLASQKDGQAEADRVAIGRALGPWADALGARLGIGAVPVVLMADLNSFDRRQPGGAQAVLRADGWSDAWRAPLRANVAINSTNYSPTARTGWPARPIRNPSGIASRVDYIMFRGEGVAARSYRVVVWLDANGGFTDAFRASDHNPVRARLAFTSPAAG